MIGAASSRNDVVADTAANGLAAQSQRFDWQQALFAAEPERAALLRLRAPWALTPARIRFHRNHAIEPALSVLRPFLEFAGFEPELIAGDYDDSLTFSAAGDADVEVIWLDYARFGERLSPAEAAAWLAGRIGELRKRTTAPLLVLDWDGHESVQAEFRDRVRGLLSGVAGVRIGDRRQLFVELGAEYFDPERASATGTRMSRRGAVHTARLLGARWLPAMLGPRLKAVVVDLDNTLWAGVLGEDGTDGIEITDGHRALQRTLLELRDSGLFLGLLSRNDPADVHEALDRRGESVLKWEDFSASSVGWGMKSSGLQTIAETLRIDPGSILFVDDNIGELLEVIQHCPRVHGLHAKDDPRRTVDALRFFPGLWTFEVGTEDALRVADLRANEERQTLAVAAQDLGAYHRELGIALSIGHDDEQTLGRVAELSRKTNQFNLALQRYTEAAVRAILADPRGEVSTAGLRDRLTDSGIIAIAAAHRRGDRLNVLELCISCRALGRRLEDLMVAQMLVSGSLFDGVEEVAFTLCDGPRNHPARTWLAEFAEQEIPPARSAIEIVVPAARLRERAINPDVKVEVLR